MINTTLITQYGVASDEVNVLQKCGEVEEGDNAEYLDLLSYLSDHSLAEGGKLRVCF